INIPAINRAVGNSDDIALISYIENIAKVENISSCFILDKNNKVIIHNNTREWNSVKKGSIYDRAVKYDGELIQFMPDDNFMLFSTPIAKSYTLCCVFSVQKAKDDARYWRIKYFTIAAVMLFLITAIFYMLAKLLIVFPFNRMKKSLEQSTANEIKKGAYNEITDIFATEREKYDKAINALVADKESLTKIIEYLYAPDSRHRALIILNSSNNIVFAYDKTGKFLKKDFEKGKHIVESSLNPNIIELVYKAAERNGKEIESVSEGYEITVMSIADRNKLYATIIKISVHILSSIQP
ncbi:MAG: hypothetical protein FWC88_02920, partial [Endomicrobia bacterium]|nr:hypothetical protein [Endomicrobiia bacterium]